LHSKQVLTRALGKPPLAAAQRSSVSELLDLISRADDARRQTSELLG
jgi:hypothetical protein